VSEPEIAVVVASHERPLRLRWLLNALDEQTLARDRWEVVVAHDSRGPETEALLRDHPLAAAGVLRQLAFPPDARTPAATRRNAAWRAAGASLIAFTDDDCRPPPGWLERALEASRRHPGAVVQGMTLPDPDEVVMQSAPWWRSQRIVPPAPWGQTCNIVYPRSVLELLGGFREEPPLEVADDSELLVRARRLGVAHVGAREALTYHAVEAPGLPARLRSLWRWRDMAFLVKHYPEVRRDLPLWIFWKRTHAWLLLALLAAARGRRSPLYGLLALPWVVHTMPQRDASPRARFRGVLELPGRLAIDATEVAALAWGSVRNRTILL
jgi:glycosyltransferase involved in cell wall biosynthesis